ncbi:MAG: DUF933 domain-containing protein [Elusimicrobia bacterium]|nr:DUF933 domain-containing protein [Elusimicrobiota bacterium]
MDISCKGLGYEAGKTRYDDDKLNALRDKFQPKKFVPFYVDITEDDFIHADIIAVKRDSLLDVLIPDIEKCETRLGNAEDAGEKEIAQKALKCLESETPLSEGITGEYEKKLLRSWTMISMKPVLVLEEEPPIKDFIRMALDKSGTMLFYTAGTNEVHSWHVRKGATIVECAAKIHTELAKGFIKGDVAPYDNFMKCHSMADAMTKKLANLVDRDYVVKPADVIEIRAGKAG